MKTLIIFYSRTGTTKKVALELSNLLQCDFEEIIDTKNRKGALGYILSGRDATLKKLTTLQKINKNIENYELVIIGTPIWSWNVSTPIRTFLEKNKGKLNKVAFFCTMSGDGDDQAFREMENIINIKPLTTLTLLTKEVAQGKFQEKINEFTNLLKSPL